MEGRRSGPRERLPPATIHVHRSRGGAHVRVRTGDLFLTKEVLCLLSYVGPRRSVPVPRRGDRSVVDSTILDNHRSTLVNLGRSPRIWLTLQRSLDGKRGGQGGNRTPTVERRLIYSQRSSPPAQPTHGTIGVVDRRRGRSISNGATPLNRPGIATARARARARPSRGRARGPAAGLRSAARRARRTRPPRRRR